MSDKPKEKINWHFVVVGAALIVAPFISNKKIQASDLASKSVTLKKIERIGGGSRSSSYYRLWTNETKAAFEIEVPGGIATNWNLQNNLNSGDTLLVKYYPSQAQNLQNPAKEIKIYSLQNKMKLYFDVDSYNQAQDIYNTRLNSIALLVGVLLILNGLEIFKFRTIVIIAITAFAIIIILRILNKF